MRRAWTGSGNQRGCGRRATYGPALEDRVVSLPLSRPPPGETHWSTRSLATKVGISHVTVHRIWRDHRIQPRRSSTYNFSVDPRLIEKVPDVVGLYLDQPEKAVVLSVDEKSQIQALDRTQPLLPQRLGQMDRRTHDYVRHGTTTLSAALDVATGEVTGRCYARHRHQDFLRFLRLVDRTYPRGQIHLVLDSDATHQHRAVPAWLRHHPRFHLHFTPTSASWMNQVATWFSLLERKAIRRGVFHSVAALRTAIQRFLDAWNDHKHPFTWVKTPDQILAKSKHQPISVPGNALQMPG